MAAVQRRVHALAREQDDPSGEAAGQLRQRACPRLDQATLDLRDLGLGDPRPPRQLGLAETAVVTASSVPFTGKG